MRRRRVQSILLIVSALVVGVYACHWYFGTSITAAHVDRIQTGMTTEEIAAIFCCSPSGVSGLGNAGYRLVWEGPVGDAVIFADFEGLVYGKHFYEMSAINQLRRWWLRRFSAMPPF